MSDVAGLTLFALALFVCLLLWGANELGGRPKSDAELMRERLERLGLEKLDAEHREMLAKLRRQIDAATPESEKDKIELPPAPREEIHKEGPHR